MNSAAELRRFTDNQVLEKAVTAVIQALSNEPLGLEISQIMNNCRLSNKTTKTVLNMIRAENQNGVWFLTGTTVPVNQPVSPQQPVIIKEVEVMPAPKSEKTTYLKRLIDLFKEHSDGITLEDVLKVLGGDRRRFDQELVRVRRYQFPVRLETVEGKRLYISDLDKKPETTAANKPEPKPTIIHELTEDELPVLVAEIQNSTSKANPNHEIQAKVVEFRGMVQERVVITKEVILNSEQLDNVLKDIFGLDTVVWSTDGDKVQVHLTQTQVA